MTNEKLIGLLSHPSKSKRKKAAEKLSKLVNYDDGIGVSNLYVHSTYSFSPYSPSMAAFMAYKFGLSVVGICDDYTLKGALEFQKACEFFSLRYTSGVEFSLTCDFLDGAIANVAILGVARKHFKELQKKIKSLRDNQKNNVLNTLSAVNAKMQQFNIEINLKSDVLPYITGKHDRVYLSQYVYLALAKKLEKLDREVVFDILSKLSLTTNDTENAIIASRNNPFYAYDLANILYKKSDIFNSKKQYHDYKEVLQICHEVGAICAFGFDEQSYIRCGKSSVDILSLIKQAKSVGFDAFCFNDSLYPEKDAQNIIDCCLDNRLLPVRRNEIEFPRQKFVGEGNAKFDDVFLNSSFAICGSEKCLNSDGNGWIEPNLKIDGFLEKLELFSKIGKGE